MPSGHQRKIKSATQIPGTEKQNLKNIYFSQNKELQKIK